MIRTESLTKYYGNRCAVRGLSLEIASREIVGFLGLNGAGKTTALRMLAGQLLPSAGRIEINGRDLVVEGEALRWGIGFLPERPPIYDDMRVGAYLRFAARLRGYDDARLDHRLEEVLELTRLLDYRDEPIANLSHGYRQRVGIAQAIVHDPELVILDEPNNGLDPAQIKDMRSLIRELKTRHTVLLSSHMLPEISQTCDRLMVIRDGALVATGTEGELSARLGAGRQYSVEVVGETALVERALHALAAGGFLTLFERKENEGRHEVIVTLAKDTPEEIARHMAVPGLGLRRLEPVASELEALFLELTHARAA